MKSSSEETLLAAQSHDRKPKSMVFCIFLVTLFLAASMVFSFLYATRKPKPIHRYLSGSARFYCHLTLYPDLCFHSMSAMLHTSTLRYNPNPLFTTSLQIALDQVNATSVSISKAMTTISGGDNNTLLEFTQCRKWASDSLSRLNDSIQLFPEGGWVLYEEEDEIKARVWAAVRDAARCFVGMEKSGNSLMVKEVREGVERARECLVNSFGLMEGRDSIVYDFNNPWEYDIL